MKLDHETSETIIAMALFLGVLWIAYCGTP